MHSDFARLKQIAIKLLARREYSREKLCQRLLRYSTDRDCINEVIQDLAEKGYVDDARFCEIFFRHLLNRGYGPIRITAELQQHNLSQELIEQCFNNSDVDWLELANKIREKRFGSTIPKDYGEKGKQYRFLVYRGFESRIISSIFKKEKV